MIHLYTLHNIQIKFNNNNKHISYFSKLKSYFVGLRYRAYSTAKYKLVGISKLDWQYLYITVNFFNMYQLNSQLKYSKPFVFKSFVGYNRKTQLVFSSKPILNSFIFLSAELGTVPIFCQSEILPPKLDYICIRKCKSKYFYINFSEYISYNISGNCYNYQICHI